MPQTLEIVCAVNPFVNFTTEPSPGSRIKQHEISQWHMCHMPSRVSLAYTLLALDPHKRPNGLINVWVHIVCSAHPIVVQHRVQNKTRESSHGVWNHIDCCQSHDNRARSIHPSASAFHFARPAFRLLGLGGSGFSPHRNKIV